MQRQVAPPDPSLTFAPPPKPVFEPPVVRARRRARLETPVDDQPARPTPEFETDAQGKPLDEAEVIPAEVRTDRGGLEVVPPPAPPAAVVPAPGAAVDLWPDPVPIFTYLAGAAGSGKTFATKEWAERDPGLVLCATTGIAAINLGGETINSVLGYFDTPSLKALYGWGDLTTKLGRMWRGGVTRLVIDEVSMLSGDQLTFLVKAIEDVNSAEYLAQHKGRTENARGEPPQMGLTLVGDFCQLPPVKAPFAFEAKEWEAFTVQTLTHIRRQDDAAFIETLRAARRGDGQRVAEYFADLHLIQHESDDHYPGATIMAKNLNVASYNQMRLQELDGSDVSFDAKRWGKQRKEWGEPERPPSTWNIPATLTLKVGALVMVLANRRVALDPDDPHEKALIYVNGDLGELVGAGEEVSHYLPGGVAVRQRVAYVRLQRTGAVESVFPVTREMKVLADAPRRKELRLAGQADKVTEEWEIVGAVTYMPLRVAYATTVHKSQGLSLDAVQVNIRDDFFAAPGMLYVALSRARTVAGLRLVGSPKVLAARCTHDRKVRSWL